MSPVTRARAGLAAVVLPLSLLLSVSLAACSGDEAPSSSPATPTTTPLSAFDTSGLVVAREPFCDRLPDDAVEEILGSPVAETSSYDNGEKTRIAPGVKDVAHEFACTWQTDDGTVARGWVFAPPVTPDRARALRRAIKAEPGCTSVADAPDFGARSVAVRCGRKAKSEVSFHGLFGDAWLACSLQSPGPDLVDRVGQWCVVVAEKLSPS